MTERQALVLLLGISTVSGVLALFSYRHGFRYSVIFVTLFVVGLVLLAVHLSRGQMVNAQASRAGTPAIQLLANFPYKRHVVTLAIDAVLIVVAYYAAYLLRFAGAFERARAIFVGSVGPLVGLQVLALAVSGTYRGLWRHTSLADLWRLVGAATLGVGGSVVYFVFTTGFEPFSRAVFVFDWALLILLLAGSRVAFRLIGAALPPRPTTCRRTVIYGAGDGGALALRELRNNVRLGVQVIGFVDDDRDKWGTRIAGLPVLGGLETAEDLLAAHEIDEVIVASMKISHERLRRLESMCAARGIEVTRATFSIR
jgi:UDP-GlcNAc:undecaprenyl-phosphate GlcNAc-1-phosphate transferase